MPEMSLSVEISRSQLALEPLQLNDHSNYFISSEFMAAQSSWNRNQATSPFLDGAVTLYRTLQMVTRPVNLECLGGVLDTTSSLYFNIGEAIRAFSQDFFTIGFQIGTETIVYQGEASDYQVNWNGPRVIANQVQVSFQVPCQPIPAFGGF